MRIKPQSQNKPDDNKPHESNHGKKHEKKEFKLPSKKGEQEAQAQLSSQKQTQEVSGDVKASEAKGARIETAQQVNNVREAILKMVDSMRIGQMDGKSLLNAQLKDDQSIHQSLRGAEVRLEMTEEGLKVHIEPVAGQQDMAQALISQHQDQVAKLQQSLAAKNINLQQLQVGDHVVELPHRKVLSPSELFSGQQLDRGKGEERKDGEPPEKIDPTEKS